MINTEIKTHRCDKHGTEYEATSIVLNGKERFSPCPKCEVENKAVENKEKFNQQSEANAKYISQLFARSGIPPRYTTRTFDNFIADDKTLQALTTAKAYAKTITEKEQTGAGLVMSGNVGTGKTHLACAIGQKFMGNGGAVLFITVTAMIRQIRETYSHSSNKTEQQVINLFRGIDLLIIDEIGLQKGSESEEHLLFEIINERYSYFKPTIIISNLNAEEIKQYIGARALDRMREGGGKFIAFEWDSYRGKVQANTELPNADGAKYLKVVSNGFEGQL